MKSLLVLVVGLLLIGSVANAAEIISDNGDGTGSVGIWNHDRYPFSITQNGDPSLFTDGSYTCGNVTFNYITDCWALRRFILADDGIVDPIKVQSVDWGVRRFFALLDSVPGPYTVTMKVGKILSTDAFLFANITWLCEQDIPITTADNPLPPSVGTPKTTVISCPDCEIDPATHDLVVAWFAPETESLTPSVRFAWSASNAAGDTRYCYYAFADCGFPEPVTPPELNSASPEVAKLIVVVNGETCETQAPGACCDPATGSCFLVLQTECVAPRVWVGGPCDPNPCPPPVPTERTSWGRVKGLYR